MRILRMKMNYQNFKQGRVEPSIYYNEKRHSQGNCAKLNRRIFWWYPKVCENPKEQGNKYVIVCQSIKIIIINIATSVTTESSFLLLDA